MLSGVRFGLTVWRYTRVRHYTIASVRENVTELGTETGLRDAEVGDTNELLQSHGEQLPKED
jgi:hypothetical protein